MHSWASDGRKSRRVVATVAATLCVLGASHPQLAKADMTLYFQGNMSTGVSGRQADVSRSTLTASAVSSFCNNCQIWAGAHYAGGTTLYASWAQGVGEACHNYGTNNIGAMIEAPYTAQNIVGAIAGWVGSGGGSYC